MWKQNNTNIKYEEDGKTNQIGLYASKLIQNQINMTNGTLYQDIQMALNGGCEYIPELLCKRNDLSLFRCLEDELKEKDIINWSKHHKYENPTDLKTFNEIIERLCKYFNVKPLHTRLNYYFPHDWKPFHHDSHAYTNNDKEDITIGASFGITRELEFKHVQTDLKFRFPQNNGDVFTFDSEINKKFMHGIPQNKTCNGNRISIIVWGKKMLHS